LSGVSSANVLRKDQKESWTEFTNNDFGAAKFYGLLYSVRLKVIFARNSIEKNNPSFYQTAKKRDNSEKERSLVPLTSIMLDGIV